MESSGSWEINSRGGFLTSFMPWFSVLYNGDGKVVISCLFLEPSTCLLDAYNGSHSERTKEVWGGSLTLGGGGLRR